MNSSETRKIFLNEVYANLSKKNYVTNRIDVFYRDNFWSLDLLDLNDYEPKNNERYRYSLVVIAYFSKFGWTVPLKTRIAQTIKSSFEKSSFPQKEKQNNFL